MPNSILAEPPKYLRAPKAKSKNIRIDPTGGFRKQGIIHGVSAIATGEALGHDIWIDETMLSQTAAAINDAPKGVKSRFTHPSLSGDGLGKFVGRMMNATVLDGKVVADQHFVEAGHKSPDGDLADYLMSLAEEDPQAYGLSIVFGADFDQMERFRLDNTNEDGEFVSPDPQNTNNYPHARLAELRAVDAVDEPAANPDGLFHREQEIAQEAEAMAAYALGLEADVSIQFLQENAMLGLDPDRVRGFVSRFLNNHHLEVKTMAESNATLETEEEITNPAAELNEAQPDNDIQGAGEQQQTETPQEEIAASGREECQRFREAFGDKGAIWYADGLTFEQARSREVQELREELAETRKQLAARPVEGEADPVDFDSTDEEPKAKGFASKIHIK